MAQEKSKQKLANLIQAYDAVIRAARSLYDDAALKEWAVKQTLDAQKKQKEGKRQLQDSFSINYDADNAKTLLIKEGSRVEVLANHMDGMKGGVATIKSYASPAMLSDLVMTDGMKMNNHRWLTNDEVKLK